MVFDAVDVVDVASIPSLCVDDVGGVGVMGVRPLVGSDTDSAMSSRNVEGEGMMSLVDVGVGVDGVGSPIQ